MSEKKIERLEGQLQNIRFKHKKVVIIVQNVDREQVKADYLSGMKQKDIVQKYNIPLNTLKSWVKRYHWSEEKKGAPKKKKKGAPLNNKNAVGNSGGGAPVENKNNLKHGLYSKYFTADTREIYESLIDADPLTLLWHNIMFLQAELLRSQQIMYVKDKDDSTSTQIGFTEGKTSGETWEVQQAWDKQANYIKTIARAEDSIRTSIQKYLELEGASKENAKEQVQDWKAAIIAIAKRRGEQKDEQRID